MGVPLMMGSGAQHVTLPTADDKNPAGITDGVCGPPALAQPRSRALLNLLVYQPIGRCRYIRGSLPDRR